MTSFDIPYEHVVQKLHISAETAKVDELTMRIAHDPAHSDPREGRAARKMAVTSSRLSRTVIRANRQNKAFLSVKTRHNSHKTSITSLRNFRKCLHVPSHLSAVTAHVT